MEGLGVELMFLHIKGRWFVHLERMPPGCLLGQVFQACAVGRRPQGRPRPCWREYLSAGLGMPQCPPRIVGGGRRGEGGLSNLDSRMNRWMDFSLLRIVTRSSVFLTSPVSGFNAVAHPCTILSKCK